MELHIPTSHTHTLNLSLKVLFYIDLLSNSTQTKHLMCLSKNQPRRTYTRKKKMLSFKKGHPPLVRTRKNKKTSTDMNTHFFVCVAAVKCTQKMHKSDEAICIKCVQN